MKFFRLSQWLLAAGAVCSVAKASAVFNFDADSLGTSTNFTETVNGLTVAFTSPADPGGFVVYPSMFATLTGNVLGDPGPAGADNLTLTASFSQALAAITLNFATSDFTTPSPFTMTAYENSNLVGMSSVTGSFLSGFSFPEGQVTFAGGVFNQIVLSSNAADFAVDNISAVAAPEPTDMALLALGLLALGIPSIRRRRTR